MADHIIADNFQLVHVVLTITVYIVIKDVYKQQ